MDREHFDAITRIFATKRSRRLALAALAGSALFNLELADSLARGKHRRRRKDHGNRSTAGLCTPLENVCVPNAGRPCCANTKCVKPFPTNKVAIPGSCQSTTCPDDATCAARFSGQDVYCEKDTTKCEGLLRASCCRPKHCTVNSQCPTSSLCCQQHCCAPGQTCSFFGCFGPISR